MADQVRYIVYRVTREDCSRPDLGWDSFTQRKARMRRKNKKAPSSVTTPLRVLSKNTSLTFPRLKLRHTPSNMNVKKSGANLDLRQDGHDGGSDAQEHVDADEDLVFSASLRVGVVDVEHDQRHQRQQVVHCGDRQQSCEHTTQLQSRHSVQEAPTSRSRRIMGRTIIAYLMCTCEDHHITY